MKKPSPAAVAAPPKVVDVKTSPLDLVRNVRVVDTATGEAIAKVISADADAGKLTRFDVDGEGNLVREKDTFKVIEEDRAIRIDWIDPPTTTEEERSDASNEGGEA